jgi:predicted acylesterase/phospholipase RssA
VSGERTHPAAQTPPTAAPPATDNLVGLAMSGGGIRSATFGLGALQALHKLGLVAHVQAFFRSLEGQYP